ncbi:MAG TPA: aspartate kinase, partial [Gammaproteobacteria bacterium]|nr:aspartate kinase [Gammaproteobacteria bacterium]
MSLIVQKYGGSSVASLDHLRRVAARIAKTREAGHDVVVVVSAMGKMTSELLGRAQSLTSEPEPRELDMLLSAGERISMSLLAMALGELGLDAISLTGVQAGIYTDETHFNARIRNVDAARVREELGHGRVVVVAGYQGLTPAGEVATLGRGGSDTTAVALAAALEAERCEICSDVDGIYSADPRVVPEAMRIERMAYEDMLALARHGARVLNARAVEYARETATPVYAVSTFSNQGGTLVG